MKIARPTADDYTKMRELAELLDALAHDPAPDCMGASAADPIAEWWRTEAGAWGRVIFGGQTALEHACDPNAQSVEWKPEYKAVIEAIESGKPLESSGGILLIGDPARLAVPARSITLTLFHEIDRDRFILTAEARAKLADELAKAPPGDIIIDNAPAVTASCARCSAAETAPRAKWPFGGCGPTPAGFTISRPACQHVKEYFLCPACQANRKGGCPVCGSREEYC